MHSGAAFTAETDTAPQLGDDPRIVIVGAGPTGLCAAYRLHAAPTSMTFRYYPAPNVSSISPASGTAKARDHSSPRWRA